MRNRILAWSIVVAGAAAAVVSAGTFSSSSSAASPHRNGPIYFDEGGGDGGTRIEAIEPDGSGLRRVFGPDGYREQIAWSPAASRIAYVGIAQSSGQSHDGQVHFGIYTSRPDGSGPRLLTEGLNVGWPAWSPDGTKIAFVSSQADPAVKNCIPGPGGFCPTHLYVMNADGTGVTPLTTDSAPEFAPAWSPAGSSIAFVRRAHGTDAIEIVDADGAHEREVVTGTGGNQRPFTWSPDGSRIAFVNLRRAGWDLDVVDADGAGRRTVFARDGVWDEGPAWSPDGSEIAFSSTLGAYPAGCGLDSDVCSDLFVVHPDGTGLTRLTGEASGVFGIAWQPLPR